MPLHPLFCFSKSGVRTITVTFHISNPLQISDLTLTQNDFVLSLTTEQGWFTVPKARVTVAPSPLQTNGGDSETIVSSPTVDSDTQEPIQFTLGLEQADPSICAYDPAVHGGSFETSVPMMKIALTNGIGSGYVYQSLRDFRLTKIDLSVTVVDAKNLIIQNDAGVLKTGKPFYPFTTVPKIGSKFYLGSREIFQKRLTDLKLSLIWGDVPANLATHYGNYGGTAPANSDFKATVDILQDSKWLSLKGNGNEINLFNSNDAQEENTIQFSNDELGTIQAGGMEDTVLPWSVESKRGFLRLTLTSPKNNAFGHGVYRDLYTKSLILFADSPTGKDSNGTAYKDLIPNAPYTPLINEISASYTARETVDPADQQALDIAGSTYYHLYPFGSKAQNSGTEQSLKLMPQFVTRQKNSEGELYIGLHGLKPAQSISLLFQLAEGSARPDLRVEPVYWSYLANNNWHPFDPAEVLKDTTNGLLNSGIVALAVPDTASKENTLLPAGLHWLRASVVGKPAALCDLISIQAQAVQASRLIASTNKNIQMQSLPAGRIKKMLTKSAAVKSVSQPFSTFGGESAEESGDFYIRSSERLRHKQRGVSISDYEKLVLQQFPAIYRAKCISHSKYSLSSSDTNSFYSEFAPGHIALIVIPHLKQNNAVNRLQPKVSLVQSEQIRSWLCNQISPFAAANMHVMNPYYEEIQVEFRVSFTTSDWGFYQKQLNTDIQNFLSPWATSEAADIVFRGRIHKSSILNFVEKLDYVDYVTDFKMHHTGGRQNFYNTNEATPTTECSILVSHQNHLINQMGENE